MASIQLTAGAYTLPSIIASAQRCLNLIPEPIPSTQGEPARLVHNPSPGTTVLSTAPAKVIRCLYTASNGELFAVCGQKICFIDKSWVWHVIGVIVPTDPTDAVPRVTQCCMADNGTWIMMVDNTVDGYMIRMSDHYVQRIDRNLETGFYGATRVEFVDTYFILNKLKTPIFYISQSEADPTLAPPDPSERNGGPMFDPLDFASKTAKADPILTILVEHHVTWLIGSQTTEVFYNTGGTAISASAGVNTFPYEAMPGAYTAVGIAAIFSACRQDNNIFFIAKDVGGQGIAVQGTGYSIQRVSTHAIEQEWATYSRIDDAYSFCYQQGGHSLWVVSFPTADKTWCYDATYKLWHERCTLDLNGHEHRIRAYCGTFAYGKNIVGDWENANLYEMSPDVYTDALDGFSARPIKRYRSFPHAMDLEDFKRMYYKQFIANLQVGTALPEVKHVDETLIDCSFTAPDHTLLENYFNLGDIAASFAGSGAQILSNQMAPITDGTSAAYVCETRPTTPDYTIAFSVVPTVYGSSAVPTADLSNVWVNGRASDANSGYQVAINRVSTQDNLTISVLGGLSHTVLLGTIDSGHYTVTLRMEGTLITTYVQRSQDGKWFDGTAWGSTKTPVYQFNDAENTYAAPGQIIFGAHWNHA